MSRQELRAHRKRLGLSVAKAAAQVHVSPRTWSRWESGERHVPETAIHLWSTLNGIPYPTPRRRGAR